MSIIKSQVLGSFFGVAVGDALGLPVEFKEREELDKNPVKEMRGYGTHNQPPGTWSDDSSLTFCTAESLLLGFDVYDMAKRFVQWLDEEYWSARGKVFDVGGTTQNALARMKKGVNPLQAGLSGERDNGNGSLMRMVPMIFFVKEKPLKEQMEKVHQVSSLTHAHPRAQIACGLYVQFGIALSKGKSLKEAYGAMKEKAYAYYTYTPYKEELIHFSRILEGDISTLSREEISSSGYVVDSLEASLWSLLTTDSFSSAVLTAVNLGGDTDTMGAITGGLAGIYYGYESIPPSWLSPLARQEDIQALGERFFQFLKKT